ncbi:MAG TPA: DUF5916 domain-containing protein, partial [Longimicrobiaceae bacterium]|nr:DUF5916 domain-containing protein [Longimicrobiaceae bacterium]
FRSWNVEADLRREWNYDGDHIYTSGNLEWSAQLLSFWEGDLSFGWSPRAFDDRLTRGGPMAVRPGNWRVSAEVESDFRRPLTGYAGAFYEDNDEGGWVLESWAGVQIKSSPRWNLSVGPGLGRSLSPAQYVATLADASPAALFGRRYLFSELRQTTVSVETRFNYTFNPELTLEVYAQPFVSGVDFGETRYLVAPRTFDFARDTTSGVEGTDFNVRSLRGNAVLRWEWRPGSTLYVAWQQSRESLQEEVGDFRFGRDRAALFGAAPDNVFVIKASYWLNP